MPINKGLEFLILILHEHRVCKMLFTLLPSLESCIGQMANLLWIKHRPFLIVKLIIKCFQTNKVYKIDKSISNITLELHINWQIKEIVFASEPLVQKLQHEFLIVLVRYVLYHDRCLIRVLYSILNNLEFLFVFNRKILFVWFELLLALIDLVWLRKSACSLAALFGLKLVYSVLYFFFKAQRLTGIAVFLWQNCRQIYIVRQLFNLTLIKVHWADSLTEFLWEVLLADVELVVEGDVFRNMPAFFVVKGNVILNHGQGVSETVWNDLLWRTVYVVLRGVVMWVVDLGVKAKCSRDSAENILRRTAGFSFKISLGFFIQKLELILVLLLEVLACLLLLRASCALLT